MGEWRCTLMENRPGAVWDQFTAGGSPVENISPDGNFAIGNATVPHHPAYPSEFWAVKWDLNTGHVEDILPLPVPPYNNDPENRVSQEPFAAGVSTNAEYISGGGDYELPDPEGGLASAQGFWKDGTFTTLLSPADAAVPYNVALDITPDGRIITGWWWMSIPDTPGGGSYRWLKGCYWYTATGEVFILPSFDPTSESKPWAISDDGNVIYGEEGNDPYAVKWVRVGDSDEWIVSKLDAYEDIYGNSGIMLHECSPDGTMALGWVSLGYDAPPYQAIVYWVADGSYRVMQTVVKDAFFVSPGDLTGITRDNSTMCGTAGVADTVDGFSATRAVLWSGPDYQDVTILPGPDGPLDNYEFSTRMYATDISADGKVVIGNCLRHTAFGDIETFPCVWHWIETPAPLRKPSPPQPPKPVIQKSVYPPVPTNMASWETWNPQIATTLNLVLAGKTNNTLANFTLTANSTTTTLRMSQIGANSVIRLTPLTPSAAEEVWFVSSRKTGEATITHSSSPSTDRTFSVMVVA